MLMFKKYKDTITRFLEKGRSPSEIAFAVALENFVGILPIVGLHTVVAIGLAHLLRLNITIVFLGTQIQKKLREHDIKGSLWEGLAKC